MNSIYYLLTKILVCDLMSPNHSSFMTGRSFADNTSLLDEMFHWYGRAYTPRRFCLSVDFMRAFDTLRVECHLWFFATLKGIGFSTIYQDDWLLCIVIIFLCHGRACSRLTRPFRRGGLGRETQSPLYFSAVTNILNRLIAKKVEVRIDTCHGLKIDS